MGSPSFLAPVQKARFMESGTDQDRGSVLGGSRFGEFLPVSGLPLTVTMSVTLACHCPYT